MAEAATLAIDAGLVPAGEDYPENELAARFGASASRSTHSSREAYADRRADSSPEPAPRPLR